MRRAIGIFLLGGVLALLAAGCGGGSSSGSSNGPKPLDKAEYVKQMKAIGHNLSTSLSGINSAADSAPKATAALIKIQTELRTAATELEAITPPSDVAPEHQQLTQAVREYANELNPIIKQVRAGHLSRLMTITSLKGITEIAAAADAISSKGYKIGA
jgi:hypothetical protein